MTKKVSFTPEVRQEIASRWAAMKIDPAKTADAISVVKRLIANRSRYEKIEKATGVPWPVVAFLHERESGGDFRTYLGNGQSLSRVTTKVPAGRGPFATWEAGALDALVLQGFDKIPRASWSDVAFILFIAEEYNGFGYRLYHPTVPTPYVWAGSDQYATGKYASDGKFDPTLTDHQLGVAIMLQTLISILGPAIIGQLTAPDTATGPQTSQATGAGVTVPHTNTVTNFLTVALGAVFAALGIQNIGGDLLHLAAASGGLLLIISGMINHMTTTGASNNNTLATHAALLAQIGTLLTQVGDLQSAQQPQAEQKDAQQG